MTQVTDTQIKCSVNGIKSGDQQVFVQIKGVGNAKNPSNLLITGIVNVKDIVPRTGSVYGGQLIEIQGNGFDLNTRVVIGGFPCFVETASASSLSCRTTDSTKAPMSTLAPATSTKVITTTARPTTTTLENSCWTGFLNGMLSAHNSYRSLHNTSRLTLSHSITATAQDYAEYLAANRVFNHSGASGLGENLAKSFSLEDIDTQSTCQCKTYF